MGTTWKLVAAVVLVGALGIGLAACGEAQAPEQTPEQARQQLLSDLDAFKASFGGLKSLTLSSSVDDVKAVKQDVQAAWDRVVASAANVKDAKTDEVEAAWNDLAQSVDDLRSGTPIKQVLPSLAGKITALQVAFDDLYNGLK